MKRLLTLFILISSLPSSGQTVDTVKEMENTLKEACHKLYASNDDDAKEKLNGRLLDLFALALRQNNSFENYHFDSLKKDIAVLNSPDGSFRIINWDLRKNDGTYEYYGFIQSKFTEVKKEGLFRKKRTEIIQLYPLTDRSAEIKNPENAITDNKKWYGMLYYKIIPVNSKGKTYYTLLGRDGNDKLTQKKIIDVLSFDNNGSPRFGADIFNYAKKYPKRVIFEYSSTCKMSLKYSAKKDSIIFDRLIPSQEKLEGQYQYYCVSFEYDGFGFKKGKWNFGTGLQPYNEKDENDKEYHNPHDRSPGSDKSNDYKKTMDENAPTGDGNKVVKHRRVKRK